jgi:hypothetical protein
MASSANSTTPALLAFAMVAAGIILALVKGGILHGSIVGGMIAAAGAIPGCYAMWKGIQQETQGPLAVAVGSVLLALAVGGALIVLGIINLVA